MAFDINENDNDEFDEYTNVKEPTPPRFYRRKKFWICCIPNTIVAVTVAVVLALYVIMPKIAQGLMNKATINFSAIDITNPTNGSMDLKMAGDMQHTGPFHADISFPGVVTVSWEGNVLGTTEIPGTSTASGGSGTLDLTSSFVITDQAAFSNFSSFMLNAESFTWHLSGKLNVKALGRTVKDLTLEKDISVNAFNGLSNITIQNFTLPGDAPNGAGIQVEITTIVQNPSAIQMYMGSLTLAISYNGTYMGQVTSSDMTMQRGANTLVMKGVLVPQNTTQDLANTSDMMSRYIANLVTNTIATGVEVKTDGVEPVGWLSDAVKNLKLTVPLQSPAPLQLIKALNLGALGLVFTPTTAYDPITTSSGVLANYTLPDGFGFSINFTQVQNTFSIWRNGLSLATLNSTYNPSTSNMALGQMSFNLLASPLTVGPDAHVGFQEFNRDLTTGSSLDFNVIGNASVYASTPIGIVNLVNIPFNATTELSGLQSLANPAPTINSIQVMAGSATSLTMAIEVVIINPSTISLSSGDVVLDLVYKNVVLGTVTLPNLSIVPGANTINATATIDPSASPEGTELLTLYTSGTGAGVNIAGTSTSTTVESLSLAFGALNIGSQMPGLQSKLLVGAALNILETTLSNGIASTIVTVNNPFVPPMTILSIDSKVTYNGVELGTVVTTFPTPPVIPGQGNGALTAPLTMNTNPLDLVTLIRAQAVKNNLNTDAFDALLSLQAGANPPSSVFDGFNVADFVTKAMTGLAIDITMTANVKVGDYAVSMVYTQTGVPTATDATILRLIPLVGTPIAQILVNGSAIEFDTIQIFNPSQTQFSTAIKGMISKTGPLDATIQFPNAVTVAYKGANIGTMMMPTVNATANVGAVLDLASVLFTITDNDAFTVFTSDALNLETFDWTISTNGLIVQAMGASMPGVSMVKTVTLKGFNKLAGLKLESYIISAVEDAGITMAIQASIFNPSTIGMTIPYSTFSNSFQGTTLGPAQVYNLTLVSGQTSNLTLNANIVPGADGLTAALSTIFGNALSNKDTPLVAQGTGAPGVTWLDSAIKTLTMSTSLPPWQQVPITSVTIDAMSMDFTCADCTWNPMAVSTIRAGTNLPFATNPPVHQIRQNIDIKNTAGNVVGHLKTAYSDASVNGNIISTVTPQAPLAVSDDLKDAFKGFVRDLELQDKYTLGLSGTTDSILDLKSLGMVEVLNIPLDVQTTMNGMSGLKNVTFDYFVGVSYTTTSLVVTNVVDIYNPSSLTLSLGDVNFDLSTVDPLTDIFGGGTVYPPRNVAPTYLYGLQLVPGANRLVSVLALPQGDAFTAAFANTFGLFPLTLGLKGSATSTTIDSLSLAMEAVATQMTALPSSTFSDRFVNTFNIRTTADSFYPPYPIDIDVQFVADPVQATFELTSFFDPNSASSPPAPAIAPVLAMEGGFNINLASSSVFQINAAELDVIVPFPGSITTTVKGTLTLMNPSVSPIIPGRSNSTNLALAKYLDTKFSSGGSLSVGLRDYHAGVVTPPGSSNFLDVPTFLSPVSQGGTAETLTVDDNFRATLKILIANNGTMPARVTPAVVAPVPAPLPVSSSSSSASPSASPSTSAVPTTTVVPPTTTASTTDVPTSAPTTAPTDVPTASSSDASVPSSSATP